MPLPRISRAIAAVLSGGLVLAGCTVGVEESDEEVLGALDEYMRVLWDVQDMTEDALKKAHMAREEFTARCMHEQGWTYTPLPFETVSVIVVDGRQETQRDAQRRGTLEYAQKFGYGVISSPEQEMRGEPDIAPPLDVNPNDAYVESLTESERAVYNEALFGTGTVVDEEFDDEGNPIVQEIDWSTMGCNGRAWAETEIDQPFLNSEVADLIALGGDDLYPSHENNEDMAALEDEWASCMAGRGHYFSTRSEAEQHVDDELARLWERVDLAEQPDGPSKDDMAALQAREIEQAVADVTCAQQVDYDGRADAVMRVAQQKFVDAHKAELDALVAKYKA